MIGTSRLSSSAASSVRKTYAAVALLDLDAGGVDHGLGLRPVGLARLGSGSLGGVGAEQAGDCSAGCWVTPCGLTQPTATKPIGLALAADAKKVLPSVQFVEAKTARGAASWAVDNDLADFADYTGCKPEVANAFNQSLFEHLREFPELRASQKFIGTCQAQFARWREIEIERYSALLQQHNLIGG
jgi:hypothetical protein